MRITIEENPKATQTRFEGDSPRCRQLMKGFVAESYVEALFEQPEIQKRFAQWLEERESEASRETRKEELRHLRRMAQRHPELATLEAEVEKQLIDLRNNVANKSTKVEISRVIDEGFLRRMQTIIGENQQVTQVMENGFVVFSASLMTGLRPSEWWDAALYDAHANPHCPSEHPTLRVRTLKQKDETDRYRNLILDGFQQPQLAMVESAISVVAPMSAVQHGYLSNGVRRLAMRAAEDEADQEIVANLDMAGARKLYAVEALREGRSKRQVAGSLGHTSDGNLRHYSEGDIYCPRKMRYPLARISEEDELAVKENLKNFLAKHKDQQQGETQDLGGTPGR